MTAPDLEEGLPSVDSFKNAKATDSSEPSFTSYFGFEKTEKFVLPDGEQYIEFKIMNEGQRAHYQSKTTRDMRMHRGTGDASMKIDPSVDRKALLDVSVTGWYVLSPEDGKPLPFSPKAGKYSFEKFVEGANPKIIDDLVEAIQKANPWMRNDVTVEMIDEQIEELQKQRAELVEQNAAKS